MFVLPLITTAVISPILYINGLCFTHLSSVTSRFLPAGRTYLPASPTTLPVTPPVGLLRMLTVCLLCGSSSRTITGHKSTSYYLPLASSLLFVLYSLCSWKFITNYLRSQFDFYLQVEHCQQPTSPRASCESLHACSSRTITFLLCTSSLVPLDFCLFLEAHHKRPGIDPNSREGVTRSRLQIT